MGTLAVPAHAQLAYTQTTFLHGFGSGPLIWTTTYSDLGTTPPAYLGQSIRLKHLGYPNLDSTKRYDGQVQNLVSYITTNAGKEVLVGHSLGSLIARGTFIDNVGLRPNIAAIIAITAPHQGTPLASNFVLLRSYLADMQRRIDAAKGAVSAEAAVLGMIFLPFVSKGIYGLGPALAGYLIYKVNNSGIDFNNLNQYGAAPALADLIPNSAAINHLNSRFDDVAIPRANVYANIPTRNAALRLYESSQDRDSDFPSLVRERDIAQELFSACKWVGYFFVVSWSAGRKCAYARLTLGRLDERWAMYVNGADSHGHARNVGFDGLVPNEDSRYPSTGGLIFQRIALMTNHLNVYKTQIGLREVAKSMQDIQMSSLTPPPPPPTPVTINGPSQAYVGCSTSWMTSPIWGVPPYTYRWAQGSTTFKASSDDTFIFTPSAPGSLTLSVTVTDSRGSSGAGSLDVTVSQGNCT